MLDSHMFFEPEKGGVHPHKGSFIFLFYESDESKLSCCLMFREFEMTQKTPECVDVFVTSEDILMYIIIVCCCTPIRDVLLL